MNNVLGWTEKSGTGFSNIKRYWSHAGITIISIGIGKGISFIWKLLLARTGPANLGAVELILNIITVLTAFSVLGFQTSVTRYLSIAINRMKRETVTPLILSALKINVIISLMISTIILIFPNILQFILQKSSTGLHSFLFIWSLPFFVLIEMILAYLIGEKKTVIYALGKYILQPAFRLILLGLFMLIGLSFRYAIPLHIAVSGIITAGILFVLVKPLITTTGFTASKAALSEFILYTIPMSGSLVIYSVYGALDTILLARFADLSVVGKYAVVVLLAEIPSVVFAPFLNLFQSYLAEYHNDRRTGLKFAVINIILLILAGGIIGSAIYVLRDIGVRLFFTPEYGQYISLLGVLLLIRILEESVVLPLRHYLDFYGFTRLTFILMVIVTAVKIIVGFIAVPRGLVNGVIWMQGISITVHAVMAVFAVLSVSRNTASPVRI